MNNPSPLIPQGSLLEQKAQSRPHLRVFAVIVAVHLVFLGGLLMQGCKKDETPSRDPALDTQLTGLPTNDLSQIYGTNITAPVDTNFPGLTGYTSPPTGPGGGLVGGGFSGGVTTPPIADPVPVPPAAPTTTDYTVARGDSFSTIGRKFGVSAAAIAKANPGVDSSKLRIGQKLHVPAPSGSVAPMGGGGAPTPPATGDSVYVVKKGDTLSKIARTHATTVTALKDINGLKTDRIHEGQKLRIPVKAPSAAPAVEPTTLTPPPYSGSPTASPGVAR